MFAAILAIFLAVTTSQALSPSQVSSARKDEFIALLKKLPTEGEFYTKESVGKAAPYLPVLFALTEKDVAKLDLYPFLAISRGLCDREDSRAYAAHHFADIRHPKLKLFWGAMLFDERDSSPDIVEFLRRALGSKEQSRWLAEALGPEFENFKRRVNAKR